jgi:fatty acid desaturase
VGLDARSQDSLSSLGAGPALPADLWKRSHNEIHHTYTNVLGRDNDLGYGMMRVDEDQRWVPMFLGQPLWNFITACFFEYAIAAYDLQLGEQLRSRGNKEQFRRDGRSVLRKIGRQMRKDYLVHPLLSGPSLFHTMAANATANLVRNPVGARGHHVRSLPRRRRDIRQSLH